MSSGEDDLFEVTRVRERGRPGDGYSIGLNFKNPLGLLIAAGAIGALIGSGAPLQLVDRDAWRAGPSSGEAIAAPLTPKPKKPLSVEGAVHSGAGLSLDWCGTSERRCKAKAPSAATPTR